MGVKVREKIRIVAVACLIWWFIAASLLAEASNINASDNTALLPNISALEGAPQANLSKALGQNYSGYSRNTSEYSIWRCIRIGDC